MKIIFKIIFMLRSYEYRIKLSKLLKAFEKNISIEVLDLIEDELNQ
jgi:hypothetical protein